MKKGESRFFLNWRMNKDVSHRISMAESDSERQSICREWLAKDALYTQASNKAVVEQFMDLNCDFAVKQKFCEKKLSCFLELMHYVLGQLLNEKITEDKAYECFKELLLRHSIQRPPFSLAIFTLADVKEIDLFAQDTSFRHFDMYAYVLTERAMLCLKTNPILARGEPAMAELEGATEIPARDIDVIYQYLTEEERAEFERQKDYMLNGPGRIETILNREMDNLH